jgi:hypothetical protein
MTRFTHPTPLTKIILKAGIVVLLMAIFAFALPTTPLNSDVFAQSNRGDTPRRDITDPQRTMSDPSGDLIIDIGSQAIQEGLPGTANFNPDQPQRAFFIWIGSLLSAAMTIAALLVLLYLIWGAIEWITAGGDSGKLQKARDKIAQAIVGIIVLSATLAIFMVLQNFLGISILTFSGFTGSGGGGSAGGGTTCTTYATCDGKTLNICAGDLCSNPGATQCLGTNPGNAAIVRCSPYPNTSCFWWKWEQSCGNLGCSGGVCQ